MTRPLDLAAALAQRDYMTSHWLLVRIVIALLVLAAVSRSSAAGCSQNGGRGKEVCL